MALVDRSGEELARYINRRKFLSRAAAATFGLAVGMAVDVTHILPAKAKTLAGSACSCAYCSPCQQPRNGYNCDPPLGQYCVNYGNYCSGYKCVNGCSCTSSYGYSNGCWCTNPNSCGDYFICCDCYCPNTHVPSSYCGCYQFVSTYQSPDCAPVG